jgi:DNA-binding HxlR family transcriptional regulator
MQKYTVIAAASQARMKARVDNERPETETEPCAVFSDFIRGALLLQEKWVLIIVFSLLSGSTGFSELMRRGNVNTTTLTQRLNLLEQVGILVKTIHSTMPPRTSYELTEAGLALRPVLEAIDAWSGKYLPPASCHDCTG